MANWKVQTASVEVTTDGGISTLVLRIDKDTEIDGTIQPTWPKDIVGIFTQYDVAAPYNWGYQIQPRDLNDIQNNGALPVELMVFNASVSEKGVYLNWETATEVNNYGFEVERQNVNVTQIASNLSNNFILSGDEGWEKVGFVEGAGNSNSNKVYSFTDKQVTLSGKFLYRLKQIDIDGRFEYSNTVEIEVGVPTKFEVAQNYPNPFNPSTTIAYSIPERMNVKVIVYNMIGEVVSVLLDQEQLAGKYKLDFNGSYLSSGTYFYRISAGQNVEVKKMIILK